LKAFQADYAIWDREQTTYFAMAPGDRQSRRPVFCRAIKGAAMSLLVVREEVTASCLADPSKYQEAIDGTQSTLDNFAKQQALMCDSGK
jgi:hypothetical protein